MPATPQTVWRITTARFADSAFSGEGASMYGGRWNPKGYKLVYTAQSQSLALLELLVQDDPLHANYVLIPAYLPVDLPQTRIEAKQLPEHWRTAGEREVLQTLGKNWLQEGNSAVLVVPSAVVPGERNFLLNPAHADFCRIQTGSAQSLQTDTRLLRNLHQD